MVEATINLHDVWKIADHMWNSFGGDIGIHYCAPCPCEPCKAIDAAEMALFSEMNRPIPVTDATAHLTLGDISINAVDGTIYGRPRDALLTADLTVQPNHVLTYDMGIHGRITIHGATTPARWRVSVMES